MRPRSYAEAGMGEDKRKEPGLGDSGMGAAPPENQETPPAALPPDNQPSLSEQMEAVRRVIQRHREVLKVLTNL